MQAVIILDFGSQYSHLIARRIRECNVYCEVLPHNVSWSDVAHLSPMGIILSGGPASVYEPDAPMAPAWVYEIQVPILGICYGLQVLAHQLGGRVAPGTTREYGHSVLHTSLGDTPLFNELPSSMDVWMSHGDKVLDLPQGFQSLAYTANSPISVMGNDENILGLQFHPEVVHTPQGKKILENFLYRICGCEGTWDAGDFLQESITRVQEQVGDNKVICALSGGVDSAVTAALIHRAIGDRLTCIFVNNGLLRRGESDTVLNTLQNNMNWNAFSDSYSLSSSSASSTIF